jgi:hypothetical protein
MGKEVEKVGKPTASNRQPSTSILKTKSGVSGSRVAFEIGGSHIDMRPFNVSV